MTDGVKGNGLTLKGQVVFKQQKGAFVAHLSLRLDSLVFFLLPFIFVTIPCLQTL